MSYKHLTINERNKIEVLSEERYSSRKISKILGYHHSTIARELNRCSNENSNGLLRAYYPKKTNLSKIPHSE